MKLTIQNIGKIEKKASIEINGITVLAGINGSGKSTIGKVLYCIYNTFYDSNRQIYEEKVYSNYNWDNVFFINSTEFAYN